jgi:hypothetical protein
MLSPLQRLKIRLMVEGITVTPAARGLLSGRDGCRPLTLADYASTSGIAMELDGAVWVNAPICDYNPNFVQAPAAILDVDADGFVVRSNGFVSKARPLPVPAYHDQTNGAGERYVDYAITHTDRVRLSPIGGCSFTCQFCDLPYKLSYQRKRVEGFVDAITSALADPWLPARHVLISGGTPRPDDFGYLHEVYERIATGFPGVEVDIMMVPLPGLLDLDWLHGIGIHALSINLELWDQSLASRYMPKKAKLTREHYLAFIGRAVEVVSGPRIRSLLMVGLEPLESTLDGVEALAARGCQPVLSPFRPDPATPLRNLPPPDEAFLTQVYERARDICDRYGTQLGPNCLPCQHNTLSFPP